MPTNPIVLCVAASLGLTALASAEPSVDWLVAGPFPVKAGQNPQAVDYLAPSGGEDGVIPRADQQAGPSRWRKVSSSGPRLDLAAVVRPSQNVVAYAARMLEHPDGGPGTLRVKHDDGATIWLNGQKLGTFAIGERLLPVNFVKGENLLLAKVDQGGGGWDIDVRIAEPIRLSSEIFTPNGDGVNETLRIYVGIRKPTRLTITIIDDQGDTVARVLDNGWVKDLHQAVIWDGKDNDGRIVEAGEYAVRTKLAGRLLSRAVEVRKDLHLQQSKFDQVKRFFPLGVWYDGPYIPNKQAGFEAELDDLQRHHMNMIAFVNVWLDDPKLLDRDGTNWLLRAMEARGMKAIWPIQHSHRFLTADVDANEYAGINAYRPVVTDAQAYPAILAYQLYDEPPTRLARKLSIAKRVVEHLDPKRPALSTQVGLERMWVNHRAMNTPVLLIDPYPVSYGSEEGDFRMKGFGYPQMDFADYLAFARKTAGPDTPLWTILQTHNFLEQLREPTPAEVRAMSWIALAHGSTGLIYFTYQTQQGWRGLIYEGRPTESYAVAAEVCKIIQEGLGTLLLNLQYQESNVALVDGNQPGEVQTFRHRKTGQRYLIAVNRDVHRAGTTSIRLLEPCDAVHDVVRDRAVDMPDDDHIVVRWDKPGQGTVLRLE